MRTHTHLSPAWSGMEKEFYFASEGRQVLLFLFSLAPRGVSLFILLLLRHRRFTIII